MANKVAVGALVCFSLLISQVYTLNCYTCATIDDAPCTTIMNCEENFPEIGPNYVCTTVTMTYVPDQGPNVTSTEKGCGKPDWCEKMDELGLQYDVCEICTVNRCNGSVSLKGTFYVISPIVLLSVILSIQNK